MRICDLLANYSGVNCYVAITVDGHLEISADIDYCRILIASGDMRMTNIVRKWNIVFYLNTVRIDIEC